MVNLTLTQNTYIRSFTSLNLERRNVGGKTIILIYKIGRPDNS